MKPSEEAQGDFYQNLRRRVRVWLASPEGRANRWSEYLLCAPDLFHLLCKLASDDAVPRADKAKLAGAIAYFISPIDLIPEAIAGPIGYLDDIALAAYVLDGIIGKTDPEVVRKHWAGEQDVLDVVRRTVRASSAVLGGRVLRRLQKLGGRRRG